MKRVLLSVAFAAIMTLASAGVSSASGTATRAPAPCPTFIGYVCLAEPDGGFQLIPAGERRTYPQGLPVVGISNGTTTLYCVLASPYNFGVGPRESISIEATVRAIGPTDGACLT